MFAVLHSDVAYGIPKCQLGGDFVRILVAVATNLIFQYFAEQNKSNATKHSLREKVSWNSTHYDVADDNGLVFVFFHPRE